MKKFEFLFSRAKQRYYRLLASEFYRFKHSFLVKVFPLQIFVVRFTDISIREIIISPIQ